MVGVNLALVLSLLLPKDIKLEFKRAHEASLGHAIGQVVPKALHKEKYTCVKSKGDTLEIVHWLHVTQVGKTIRV